MTTAFKLVMAKMQVLGQPLSKLTDCSDVVPKSKPFSGPIKYPASFSQADVQIAVSGFHSNFNSLCTEFRSLMFPVPQTALPQPCHRCGSCPNRRPCVSSFIAFCR